MKRVCLILMVLTLISSNVLAQQLSLFDDEGEAVAYIDYGKDGTIFMWSGTPVAFIEKDDSEMCVFGFNGSFLGWCQDGVLYDKRGYIVGARKGVTTRVTKIEGIKGLQGIVPIKPVARFPPIPPISPILKSSWSNTPLAEFLFSGKK